MPGMDDKARDPYKVLEDSRRYWLLEPALLQGDKSLVAACLLGRRIYDLLSVQVPLREMETVCSSRPALWCKHTGPAIGNRPAPAWINMSKTSYCCRARTSRV